MKMDNSFRLPELTQLRIIVALSQGDAIVQRASLHRQAHSNNAIQRLPSAPHMMNTDDAGRIGLDYWSRKDVLHFLEQLLENESIGVAAYAAIGRTAAPEVADLAFESELAQGAICILLKKEIFARGEADIPRRKMTGGIANLDGDIRRMVEFASRNQAGLADIIEEAVLSISDSELNEKLVYLLLLHRKQAEQLETFIS
jgi:hypothetical protein